MVKEKLKKYKERKIISNHPNGELVEPSQKDMEDKLLNEKKAIEEDKTIQKLNNLKNRKYIWNFIEKNAYITSEKEVINGINHIHHKIVLRCTMVGGPNSKTWMGIIDLYTKYVKISQYIKLSEFKKDSKFYREQLITDMIDKIIVGDSKWGYYLEQDFIQENKLNFDHLF